MLYVVRHMNASWMAVAFALKIHFEHFESTSVGTKIFFIHAILLHFSKRTEYRLFFYLCQIERQTENKLDSVRA